MLDAKHANTLKELAKKRKAFLNSTYDILDEEIRKAANCGMEAVAKTFTTDRETIEELVRVLTELGYNVTVPNSWSEDGEKGMRIVIRW